MNNNKSEKKFTKHDLEMERWRGEVTQGLKDIVDVQKNTNERVCRIEKRLIKAQVKMASIGATIALIVTIVIILLKELIAGR